MKVFKRIASKVVDSLDGVLGIRVRRPLLYFLYFILGIQLTLCDYSVRQDFRHYGISIAVIGIKSTAVICIWYVKCIPATLSDWKGWYGLYRKPYIILGNAGACLVCVCLGGIDDISEPAYLVLLFLLNVLICLADVNYDACLVEDIQDEPIEETGSLMLRTQLCRTAGSITGDVLGPLVWEAIGSKGAFSLLAMVCSKAMFSGCFLLDYPKDHTEVGIKEISTLSVTTRRGTEIKTFRIDDDGNSVEETSLKVSLCSLTKLIWAALSNDILRRLLGVTLLTNLFPGSSLSMFYYLTEELGFTPKQMSVLGIFTAIGRVLGILSFAYTKAIPLSILYFGCALLGCLMSLSPLLMSIRVPNIDSITSNSTIFSNTTLPASSYLGLNAFWLSGSSDGLSTLAGVMQGLPLSSVVATVCKRAVAGGALSTVLGLTNAFSGLGRLVDSSLTQAFKIDHGHYENLWKLTLTSTFCQVVAVCLTIFIPYITVVQVAKVHRVQVEQAEFYLDEFNTRKHLPVSFQSDSWHSSNKQPLPRSRSPSPSPIPSRLSSAPLDAGEVFI